MDNTPSKLIKKTACQEIGSEYHRVQFDFGHGLTFPRSGTLVFSGRTAIEAVLDRLPEVHTALLPSYCCDSMIQPFQDAKIEIRFFDVFWDDGLKIEKRDDADILLWCNYFGFKNEMPEFDGIVVEDITHSLLSDRQYHECSKYLVASIRKWEPVNCGGYCSIEVDYQTPPQEFVHIKSTAMELKAEYLNDLNEKKKHQFLEMFAESNHWITKNYSRLLIDQWSSEYICHLDIDKQRDKRRKNAEVLYEGLKGRVQFMFPMDKMDCPLFVPVLLPNRNEVRAYLTKNEIYCPVHWPKPKDCESNIYDIELSLICDQRYGTKDMERIVSTIKEVI